MSTTGLLGRLDAAVDAIRKKSKVQPIVGLVLGSGLGGFAQGLADREAIPYDQIPHFPVSTGVVGHAGELVLGSVGSTPVVVLSGRVHFYEGRVMADVVFPARVLARMGARAVILTNAAGGVRLSFKPGDLMLITDHINGFGTNPLIGPNEDALGPRFPDMSVVYDTGLRKVVKSAAAKLRIPVREGVYIGLTGPSYETPAEIRMLRRWGVDAVGMSTVPEAIAARHMGMEVLGMSCITNMAAGVLPQPLDHNEVMETARKVKGSFIALLEGIVERL